MLPSKRTAIILAILIVIFGGFFVYSYTRNSTTNYTNTNSNALVVATSTFSVDSSAAKIDSDNDGLPDWEEALYGTDAHNPDTDGDGTPDGKEVTLGRNPLVKGPKDLVNPDNSADNSTSTKENLTPTDVFARDFFAQYVNLKESGVTVTADNASQIASNYLKNAPLPTIQAKQYTTNDIKIVENTPAGLSGYQEAFIADFTKNWPNDPNNNEMLVLKKTFGDNNPSAIDGLSGIITIYERALNTFLLIQVPRSAVTQHLSVLNSLSTYIQTLKMIQSAFTDPMSGYVALNSFMTNQSNLIISMANLRIFLINSLK